MIEVRFKTMQDGSQDEWTKLFSVSERKASDYWFETFEYRIGNKIYTELNVEFEQIVIRERLWATLRGDYDEDG